MPRLGVSGFQPERLALALDNRGLNQVQLASLLKVSPGSISRWLSGAQSPGKEYLDSMADHLGVTSDWFTRVSAPRLTVPLFRKLASAYVSSRAMLTARLQQAHEIVLDLTQFLDLPPVNLPERDFADPEEITQSDIEKAALECRDRWGLRLGPIPDLLLAVEGAGVVVVRQETGAPNIEGLSAWSAALGRPIVLLAADKANAFRSRFDLAHEVAHLVLHRKLTQPIAPEKLKLVEHQAHRFAAALLMPAETFLADIRSAHVSLNDLLVLKQRWGASGRAALMRMKTLKVFTHEHQVTTVFKRISQRWGGTEEPHDHDRAPERPRLLRRSLELLMKESVLTPEAIPRHLGISEHALISLLSLPAHFLEGQSSSLVTFPTLRKEEDSTTDAPEAFGTLAGVLPFKRRVSS